ncbi:hypothetical protein [Pseudomonas synxantha]|jgi:hypothetical protein|nr:hypothetical protein [Pseudomonas synxantha]
MAASGPTTRLDQTEYMSIPVVTAAIGSAFTAGHFGKEDGMKAPGQRRNTGFTRRSASAGINTTVVTDESVTALNNTGADC